MSVSSVVIPISVARYVVDAHKVLPASDEVLNWALPIVEAHALVEAKAVKTVRKAKTVAPVVTVTAPIEAPASPAAVSAKGGRKAKAVVEAVVEAVVVTVAIPAKGGRKAKAKAPNALLVPVDGAPAAVPTAVVPTATDPTATDPLKNHKYRLQTIDAALCMARKIDQKNPIPGTRKGDEGATKMYWPEKQCSRKPLPGNALCKQCVEKEDAIKATQDFRDWYGRLDEPIIHTAMVIGCGQFFEKYPKGLLNDPTSAPTVTNASTVTTVTTAVDTPAPAAKKTRVTKTKAKAAAAESTAITDEAVPDAKWETFLHESRPLIRNLKSQKVYEVNPHKTTHEEMVLRNKCVGRWVDGALDPYAAGDDSDEE